MQKISIKRLVHHHWRTVLLGTMSVTLSACVGKAQPSDTSSSSVPAESSSVASISSVSSVASSSSAPVSSQPASSSSQPVISSVASSSSQPASSSQPVSSSSQAQSSSVTPEPEAPQSILSSPGTFDSGFEAFEVNSALASSARGQADFVVSGSPANPWDVQLWHEISIEADQQYTVCYDAKADVARQIEVNIDDNDPTYATVIGAPFNGGVTHDVTTTYITYSHTFAGKGTVANARLTFNMGQTNGDVQLDNIGVFEGPSCGVAGSSTSSQGQTSSAASSTPVADVGWTIEKIGCNDADDYNGEALVLFDGTGSFDGTFGNKNFSTSEYANLSRQGASDYVLSNAAVDDASCNNRKVHTGTWVKKLADATNQHSNFVNKFDFAGKTIGDIDAVVLEMRINSNLTDVPTKQELIDQYGSVIGTGGVNTLDGGKVNFAITLGDPDATDAEVRAEAFLEIDQDLYRDEWIRITIPKDAFFFWQNENWKKTPVSEAAANSVIPTRIALFPETKGNGPAATHGYTVRNVYGYDAWTTLDPTPAEDFKEMNISIRTFEVRFEPTPEGGIPQPPVSSSSAPSSSSAASSSSAPAGVSEQERQARIAAGESLFKTGPVNCQGCHGTNGVGGFFGSIVIGAANNVCDTCATSYDDLVTVIADGVPGTAMPVCKPEGDCANQLADYVWGELNGKELPVIGGSQPVTASGFIVEDFESGTLKTVPAGWRTFVGYVPDNNNSASQVFVDDTRAYTGTKSLKVDGGTGPAQIVKAIPAGVERVYMRAWVYMDRAMGNDETDNHEHIFAIKQNENNSFSANSEIRVGQGKGHLGFNIVPDSDAISPPLEKWYTGPQTPVNEWYCAEAAFITDTAYDEVHFYVNGELVNSVKKASDWHAPVAADWLTGDLGFAAFGWHSFSSHSATLWFDDIVVSESPIGC